MYRKVQNEWWVTPHVIYTLTDDYDNVVNGSEASCPNRGPFRLAPRRC